MPISITNREEKGGPLTMIEMDNDILERIVDFLNALEALMSISLNSDGTLKNPGFFSGASSNGTDSYTATIAGVTSQAQLLGKLIILKVDVANSGPATLNVSPSVGAPFGAFPIVRFQDQLLESNYIKASSYIFLTWDGALYIMQSFPGIVPPMNYALDTGAVNALVVTQSGYIDIPATLYPGYAIMVKAASSNTGASTLKLGSFAPIALKRQDGSDLIADDIVVNRIFQAVYDGVNLVIPAATGAKKMATWIDGATLDTRTDSDVSAPHTLGTKPDFLRVVLLCDADDGGMSYTAGDEIEISNIQQNDGDPAFQVKSDTSNIHVRCHAEGHYQTVNGTASGLGDLDPTKWKIKIYAARL